MSKKTVREFTVKVTSEGQLKALKELKNLNAKVVETEESVGELDRKLKATAGATSNTTKAFAKQAQGLGGLVHVYATVAAHVFALGSAYEVLKRNSDLSLMERAAESLGRATGTNFVAAAKAVKSLTNNTISLRNAMQTTNLALAGGLDLSQLKELTAIATKAAAATGRSVPESVQRMIQAVVKGEPELVDEFGIILRIGKATQDYAAAHHKAADALTTFERQQAIATQAIERGKKAYDSLKLKDIVNPYSQLSASLADLSNSLIEVVAGPLGTIVSAFSKNTFALGSLISSIVLLIGKKAIPTLSQFRESMAELATKTVADTVAGLERIDEAWQDLEFRSGHVLASQRKINKELPLIAKKMTDLGSNTAFAKAIARGFKGDELNKAFARTIGKNGSLRKEFDNLFEELEDKAKKSFRVAGATINREEARVLLAAALKQEEFFTKTVKGRLNALAESQAATIKSTELTTRKLILEWKSRFAAYKALATEAFASGAKAESLAAAKAKGNDLGGATRKSLTDIFGSETKLGKYAVRFGAIAGIAGNIVSKLGAGLVKLTGWGLALSVVASIASPIANALGLWDSSLSETVEKTKDIDKLLKDSKDVISNTTSVLEDASSSYNDVTAALKGQEGLVSTIAEKMKQIAEAARATAEMNFLQKFFKGADLDKLSQNLTDLLERAKSAAPAVKFDNKQTISVSKTINKPVTDYLQVGAGFGITEPQTIKFKAEVDLSNIPKSVDNLAKKIKEKFGVSIDEAEALAVSYVAPLIQKVAIEPIDKATKRLEFARSDLLNAATGVDDAVKKLGSAANRNTPITPILQVLDKVKRGVAEYIKAAKAKGGKLPNANEELKKAINEAGASSTFAKLGIRSVDSLNAAYNRLTKSASDYLQRQEEIKRAQIAIRAINKDSTDAALKSFEANKTLKKLQLNALRAEINLLRENQKLQTKGSTSYNLLASQIRTKRASAKALEEDIKNNYNAQKRGIVSLQVEQKKLEDIRDFGLSTQQKGLLNIKQQISGLESVLTIGEKLNSLDKSDLKLYDKLAAIYKERYNITRQFLLANGELLSKKLEELSIDKTSVEYKQVAKQLTENNLRLNELNTKEIAKQLELEKQKHEKAMGTIGLGDKGFNSVALKELDYTIKRFEKSRRKWAQTVVHVFTDPIVDAMDTLTSEIMDGTKSISGAVRDSLKSAFDTATKLIMEQLADNFKRDLLNSLKRSNFFGLGELLGSGMDRNTAANEATAQNTAAIARALDGQGVAGSDITSSITSSITGGLSSALGSVGTTLFGNPAAAAGSSAEFAAFDSVPFDSISASGISSSSGIFSDFFSSIGSFFGFAKGGILEHVNAYASGGVVSSPQLALIGEGKHNEAVVPLPDNRSIPVDLKNQGGITNNVTVQVNITEDNSSKKIDSDGTQAKKLGNMISSLVEEKLVEESRPGGLLYNR